MATLTFTFTTPTGEAGASLRAIGRGFMQCGDSLGMDRVTAGAIVAATLDNAPSSGVATIQITSGWPNPGSAPVIRV